MTEKRFHPFAVLHLLRKTILVYLLPLVQVLFARNRAALWAALAQDVLLLALLKKNVTEKQMKEGAVK